MPAPSDPTRTARRRLSFGADGKKRRTISLPGGLRKTDEVGR